MEQKFNLKDWVRSKNWNFTGIVVDISEFIPGTIIYMVTEVTEENSKKKPDSYWFHENELELIEFDTKAMLVFDEPKKVFAELMFYG